MVKWGSLSSYFGLKALKAKIIDISYNLQYYAIKNTIVGLPVTGRCCDADIVSSAW